MARHGTLHRTSSIYLSMLQRRRSSSVHIFVFQKKKFSSYFTELSFKNYFTELARSAACIFIYMNTLTPIHRGSGGLGRNGRPQHDTCLLWRAALDAGRGFLALACRARMAPAVSRSARAFLALTCRARTASAVRWPQPSVGAPHRLACRWARWRPANRPHGGSASRSAPFRFRLPAAEAG